MTAGAGPLHVRVGGAGRTPGDHTFLLVHGFGATSYTWRHWVPELERRGRVLLVDLKGFGRSQKPDDGAYAPRDQVRLVGELVDLEDPAKLTLVGHSYGGGIALLTALAMTERGDDRLARLVLVAGAAYRQRLPPFVTLAHWPRASSAALRLLGPGRVIGWVLRSIVADPGTVDAEQVEAYAAPLRAAGAVRAMLAAAREIVPDDLDELTPRLPLISVPTLLVWGRRDRVVPLAVGERLARELPRAELHVMDCGHIPHEEEPAASLTHLRAFLDRT